MLLKETYNIHKKINCVVPFFKSKKLCKKGIHNYRIKPLNIEEKIERKDEEDYCIIRRTQIVYYGLKCFCCGQERELKDVL